MQIVSYLVSRAGEASSWAGLAAVMAGLGVQLDPGLWQAGSPLLAGLGADAGLRPSQLVIPLDTHVGQICQFVGLTRRKSLNWSAALEITARLKQLDPVDPVRHDFALARLGILDQCRKQYLPEVCGACELRPACGHALRARAFSRIRRRTVLSRR